MKLNKDQWGYHPNIYWATTVIIRYPLLGSVRDDKLRLRNVEILSSSTKSSPR